MFVLPMASSPRRDSTGRRCMQQVGGGVSVSRRPARDHPAEPRKELLMRVIDMECSVPKRAPADGGAPAAGGPAVPADSPAAGRPTGYGMANYERIFRSRRDGGD